MVGSEEICENTQTRLRQTFNNPVLRLFFKKKKKYGVLCNLAMHNSSNFLNVLVHLKLLQWLAQPFKGQSHPFQTSLPVSYCCLYGSLLKFLSYLSGAWLMERKAQELGIMAWIASFSKCKPCWVKNLPFTQLTSAFPEVGTHDTPPHCLQQFAHVKRASTSNVLPTPHSPSEEKIAKCWVPLACLAEQVFFFFFSFLTCAFPFTKTHVLETSLSYRRSVIKCSSGCGGKALLFVLSPCGC